MKMRVWMLFELYSYSFQVSSASMFIAATALLSFMTDIATNSGNGPQRWSRNLGHSQLQSQTLFRQAETTVFVEVAFGGVWGRGNRRSIVSKDCCFGHFVTPSIAQYLHHSSSNCVNG